MARYRTEAEALEDGYRVEHRPEHHDFAVLHGERVVGIAHYTLRDAPSGGTIDFDHTEVVRELRGTGLSEVLANRALTDEVVHGRRVRASCWFIDEYLAKHPELLGGTAED
ncbi:MAG: N-acetyltransferase [Leucobacter sp.]|nr:N-acetyltransferase [Leucobacter sp.]